MKFKAKLAWVDGAWASNVLLESDVRGFWTRIQPNASATESDGAEHLGCVVPGLVNAHSHAFQRAIAGLTECSSQSGDDFWSWRDRMYRVALRIGPDHLESIATWLYSEMLRSGYTHVCEFHYLHRNPDGQDYADTAEMTWALVRAAGKVGIGLTMLPTLYMNQGFGQAGLNPMQRRFASTPESILEKQQSVIQYAHSNGKQSCLTSGVAIHSLRAVAVRQCIFMLPSRPKKLQTVLHTQDFDLLSGCLRTQSWMRDGIWSMPHTQQLQKLMAFKRNKPLW